MKKLLLIGLSVFSINAFSSTNLQVKEGVWYFSEVYEGNIYTKCFTGYPNNPFENKTQNYYSFQKRNYHGLSNSDIALCKQTIACNKSTTSKECKGY